MNTLDNQYHTLLKRILEYGVTKGDRTGTGTLSVFGGQFTHDMSEGFPLLTTKKMAVKTMMTELKWFLKGDTNIKYLVDNGCNIWNGDAYKNYRNKFEPSPYQFTPDTMEEFINKIKTDDEFAEEWGGLGPIYGKQWRDWTEYYVEKFNGGNPIIVERTKDQMETLIDGLKNNPNSRRHMVSAWNVGDLGEMTLPPCHYGFQCYVSGGKLSLMWNQRSVDTFLGLPFNIASYGTLLLLLCEETGYTPGDLIGNLGDVHIYNNHIEQVKEQLQRSSFPLPTIELSNVDILNGEFDYEVKGYESHPSIKAPLSN
jgi:thymidylate synthase